MLTEIYIEAILIDEELADQGMGFLKIGKQLGIGTSTVQRAVSGVR